MKLKSKTIGRFIVALASVLILTGCSEEIGVAVEVIDYFGTEAEAETKQASSDSTDYDYIVDFPEDRYPETSQHIGGAIEDGQSAICTIDRDGADSNRSDSLRGIDTKDGYDRDEFPMAMCEEGGEGASVKYIDPSDNRGAGSWFGNEVSDYPDGTRVLIEIEN